MFKSNECDKQMINIVVDFLINTSYTQNPY